MGNSGGGSWGQPPSSYIQVFTIKDNWDEQTLSWNNSPQAFENVSGAWVDPLPSFPGWPGVLRTWDVTSAVTNAYNQSASLQIALYSADSDYHTGKYFVSSDTADWNAAGRPALEIVWANP